MSTALIIATDQRLGLEFMKRYSALGWKIIAARRKPKEAFESKTPAKKNSGSVDVLALDVCGEKSVQDLADTLDGPPIKVLISQRGDLPAYTFFGNGPFSERNKSAAIGLNIQLTARFGEAAEISVAAVKKILENGGMEISS